MYRELEEFLSCSETNLLLERWQEDALPFEVFISKPMLAQEWDENCAEMYRVGRIVVIRYEEVYEEMVQGILAIVKHVSCRK